MFISEKTKSIIATIAFFICIFWLVSYAEEYKFTTADTFGIAWDRPPAGDVVKYYSLCIQDTTTGLKNWQTFSEWDTMTCAPKWCKIIDVPLKIGHYYVYLIAGNDGGQSLPSDKVLLWITEPAPKKPCCIIMFLKKLFGIEQSAQPSEGKKRWMRM